MDQATQQNAAMVEQSTAATHALTGEIGRIVGMIRQFETGNPALILGKDAPGDGRRRPAA
jgi:methyl-accepting chemotaxis protein